MRVKYAPHIDSPRAADVSAPYVSSFTGGSAYVAVVAAMPYENYVSVDSEEELVKIIDSYQDKASKWRVRLGIIVPKVGLSYFREKLSSAVITVSCCYITFG